MDCRRGFKEPFVLLFILLSIVDKKKKKLLEMEEKASLAVPKLLNFYG